jgi:hypothetical protein
VFADHLRLRRAGQWEEDLERNYADDVVMLTPDGVYRGKEGVRRCAGALLKALPCLKYQYRVRRVAGEVAFLEWSAWCEVARVDDGVDSFVIRGGRIVAQTVHYTVRPRVSGGGRRPRGVARGKRS